MFIGVRMANRSSNTSIRELCRRSESAVFFGDSIYITDLDLFLYIPGMQSYEVKSISACVSLLYKTKHFDQLIGVQIFRAQQVWRSNCTNPNYGFSILQFIEWAHGSRIEPEEHRHFFERKLRGSNFFL